MTPTRFRKPRTGDKPLRVEFRCGHISRFSYVASQLRWSDTDSPFDIVGVEFA